MVSVVLFSGGRGSDVLSRQLQAWGIPAGRIVDRNSVGIEGVTLELRDYPSEANVIATAATDQNGNAEPPPTSATGDAVW